MFPNWIIPSKISSLHNRTEDLLVARNEIESSCYSYVSFPLLLLRSSVSTEDLIVILMFLFLFYYYYYYCSSSRFCARDFSETDGSIFMKLSGKMCHKMVQMGFFQFFENHFRSWVMADFPFLKSHFVRQLSLKRFEIESSNFQGC